MQCPAIASQTLAADIFALGFGDAPHTAKPRSRAWPGSVIHLAPSARLRRCVRVHCTGLHRGDDGRHGGLKACRRNTVNIWLGVFSTSFINLETVLTPIGLPAAERVRTSKLHRVSRQGGRHPGPPVISLR